MKSLADLKKWFLEQRRDMPWRDSPTPYAVWVSEVMLQQTQVAVVIPYFLHWMELFPTIESLAQASSEQVIKAWEGLGYYSRARNLHAGARYVLEKHNGILPDSYEELAQIKGLGPYTIGAILSFAFHKKAAAVDGNVVRVLTRLLGISDDISKPKTIDQLRCQVLALLPEHEPWVINEALIELGATVCQKKARCGACPLKNECRAYIMGTADQLPYKSAKTQYEKLERTVAVISCKGHYLVRRSEEGEIMKDLHQFLYFDSVMEPQQLGGKLKQEWTLELNKIDALEQVNHSFTKYRVKLHPFLCTVKELTPVKGYDWRSHEDLQQLAFSSGHRRIWAQLCSANFKYL
jgi:A/G-specific adenine glycosylase